MEIFHSFISKKGQSKRQLLAIVKKLGQKAYERGWEDCRQSMIESVKKSPKARIEVKGKIEK